MSIPIKNPGKKHKPNGAQLNILYYLANKLKYALETEKRYLNANLSLNMLVKKLYTNREYFSRTTATNCTMLEVANKLD